MIHPAATAVGQAAIQIAKCVGAEVRYPVILEAARFETKCRQIYVTVTSEEEAELLDEAYEISPRHCFTYHDGSLAATLKRETNTCGVDLVFSSASDESHQALRDCVADFGKTIGLGETGSFDAEALTMRRFLKTRYHCCVDMAQLARRRPQRMGE